MKKARLFILVSLVFVVRISFAQDAKPMAEDTLFEDSIIAVLSRLPEIEERQLYLDSLTKGKGHISYLIQDTPTKSAPYYEIQVGYNSEIRFEVYYTFHVYKNLKIRYLDPYDNSDSDRGITLEEWRKRRANGELK